MDFVVLGPCAQVGISVGFAAVLRWAARIVANVARSWGLPCSGRHGAIIHRRFYLRDVANVQGLCVSVFVATEMQYRLGVGDFDTRGIEVFFNQAVEGTLNKPLIAGSGLDQDPYGETMLVK